MNWLNRWRNWMKKRPTPRKTGVRLEVESLEDRLIPTVTFGGGSVLSQVEAQALYLGQNWSSGALAPQQAQIETALNSMVTGPYLTALSNAGYGVGPGTTTKGANDPLSLANGATLTDARIQTELQQDISNHTLVNPDANRLYVIYVQPNVVVSASFGNSTANFSGYHGGFTGHDATGTKIAINYAVLAYPGGSVRNLGGFTADIQNLTLITSHELAESVTDPWSLSGRTGWTDTALPRTENEIGDITEKLPGADVNLNGYMVQQVAGKNDQMIDLVGATQWVSPAQTVAEMPNGSTYIIWGPNRTLWFHDATGWYNEGATGVQAISGGSDGILDVVFTDRSLYQLRTKTGTGLASVVGWVSSTPLASGVNIATEGPRGEVFATFGIHSELREFVGGAWRGVGSNGGLVPVGQGIQNVTALSESADRTLDVVLGNDSLFQFNAATGFWNGSTPLARKVGAVAAGAHGEVFLTTGPDQRLGQLNKATGAVTDLASPWVVSLSLGTDNVLDAVFADSNTYQHILGPSGWPWLTNGTAVV